MLFNSLPFVIFLPVVFLLYWSLQKAPLRFQNLFIIMASYFFYGWWDWRFLSLIIVSSATDYFAGLLIHSSRTDGRRKGILLASLAVNLGILAFFKYFNFFAASFADLLGNLGIPSDIHTLRIVLPIGISFYTFQTMSYTIDVYRRRMKPTRDAVSFFAFVSFFPQLVAGPIERAANLLPQFLKRRSFDYGLAVEGARQILWGLFKKIAVADAVASSVGYVYRNFDSMGGLSLWIGTFLFGIQIYCDFSGYSDIAIGTAKLLGFKLMRNFAMPYFSRDIPEFWSRWHISLSTWFRDYVFIPLCGGSHAKPSNRRRMAAVIATFCLSGLWHGAGWHFILWGLLHGVLYLMGSLARSWRLRRAMPEKGRMRGMLAVTGTFVLVTFAWVFFRSPDISVALTVAGKMLNPLTFVLTSLGHLHYHYPLGLLPLAAVVLLADRLTRGFDCPLGAISKRPKALRWLTYSLVIWMILYHLPPPDVDPQQFIYFQF